MQSTSNVRKYRELLQLSQEELSKRSGISRVTISYLETNASRGAIDTAQKLLVFFSRYFPDITLEDLFESKWMSNVTHGMSKSRIYHIWCGMKARCSNKSSKNYGGRGITVCDEWANSFDAFYEWSINNGYADDLTIDRTDNDGIYEPDNCRWTTYLVQNNNRRSTGKSKNSGHIAISKEAKPKNETRLKKLIKEKGLKQGWIAKQIGVNNQTVTNWAKGYSRPSDSTMVKLAIVLGLSLKATYALFDDEKFNLKVTG